MPKVCRKKQRTKTTKKRKGYCGKRSSDPSQNIAPSSPVNFVNSESNSYVNITESPCTSVNSSNPFNLSNLSTASSQKVQHFEAVTPTRKGKITGYRIIDTEILSNVIETLLCPTCETCTLILTENFSEKCGLASSLLIKCTHCKFTTDFYTSKTARRGFYINKRITYAMRVLGQGHGGIENIYASYEYA